MRKLPHPNKVMTARDWLRAGAPAASRNHSAVRCVRILLDLIEALPSNIEMYNYGTPAWRRAMKLPPKSDS